MDKWHLRWLSPLLNERGEVGGDEGTAGEGNDPDPGEQPGDTGHSDAGTSSKPGEAAGKDSFFDPSQLPPELKEQWSKMHRAYTKRLEKFRDAEQKAQSYDRFYSDEEFRTQTLHQAAQQLGYTLTKAQGSQSSAAPSGEGAPRELIDRVKARLDPSLHWMAESLANTQWETIRAVMGPKEKEEAQRMAKERATQYEELADQMSEKVPGWEEHEDDMLELLDFIKSDRMSHKKYGSKLELLYGLITGNAAAIGEATRRMTAAARNRTVTGQTNRSGSPNFEDRIRKAKTTQEAWKIAEQEAEAILEKDGIRIP